MADLKQQALQALSKVIDPDLGRDIVSLNMVQDLTIENELAAFRFVLTTPACPLKNVFLQQCTDVLTVLDGIDEVKITWDSQVPRGLHGNLDMPIQNIIAVTSGKGGVGKSTVSTNLAVALAQHGASVGLMDADILGPNIPTMVGLGFAPPRIVEEENGKKMLPYEAYNLKVMSMGFLADPRQAMIWRGPMLHSAIRQFFTDVKWGNLDYMVVDLPPGTGDAQLSLAQSVPLTGSIIVSQPQQVAVEDARRAISMFDKLNVPILGVVENMAGEIYGEGGGEQLAKERGVPFLGRIPLYASVRKGGDSGRPVVAAEPDSPAGKAFLELAQTIAQHVSVIAMQKENIVPISIIG